MNQALLSCPFPDVIEEHLSWGSGKNGKTADKYKAIVNRRNGKVFSIVSQDYRLIRHEDAIQQIEDAISENPQLGNYEARTFFYNDGARMRTKYLFPGILVEISPNDEVNLELNLFNSYDTTWPFIVALGAYRVICANGLTVGRKYLHYRKKHTLQFDKISIKDELSSSVERFNLQSEEWKQWSDTLLTYKIYDQVMKSMEFGKKATEVIEKRVSQEAKGKAPPNDFPIITLWAFYNVLTWYITHCTVSLNHQVELEKRLRAALICLVPFLRQLRRMRRQ